MESCGHNISNTATRALFESAQAITSDTAKQHQQQEMTDAGLLLGFVKAQAAVTKDIQALTTN